MEFKPIGFVVDRDVVEVLPEYEEGLEGLKEGTHVWIIYHMHKAGESLKVRVRGVGELKGVFATRSPNRPNRIGLTASTVRRIEGRRIYLDYLDAIVGSPVLDIKPYAEIYDCLGSVLNGEQIRKRIIYDKLIENYIDLEKQIQPNGFDCTVRSVFKLKGVGRVGFDLKGLPDYEEIEFEDWVFLERGYYKVILNEKVNMPNDLIAIARPRSTLIRCGANVLTAVWDAGYVGRSEVGLVVYNDGIWIEKNARIVQLVFMKLSERTRPYRGSYQFENL